jgi:hypothetical protein
LTDSNCSVRLFRNRKSGKRLLTAEEPNGDLIYAELDENDNAINAGNRFPKEQYNETLDDYEMEADYDTVGFTFSAGKFVKGKRPERL